MVFLSNHAQVNLHGFNCSKHNEKVSWDIGRAAQVSCLPACPTFLGR